MSHDPNTCPFCSVPRTQSIVERDLYHAFQERVKRIQILEARVLELKAWIRANHECECSPYGPEVCSFCEIIKR